MSINIDYKGHDKVQALIKKAMEKYPEQTLKAIELSVIEVEGAAKKETPFDTGRLRASITYSVTKGRKQLVQFNGPEGAETLEGVDVPNDPMTGVVGTNVEYGVFQELGTKYMPANPFLLPGLLSKRSRIMQIFKDVLNKVEL